MVILHPAIPPLTTSGAAILGGDGQPVRLSGVNWGGAQQDETVPYGLDILPRADIIGWITGQGFNTVRVPFAEGTFFTAAGQPRTGPAKASRLAANTDLQGAAPGEVYHQLVDDLTAAGLLVFCDFHQMYPGWCCSADDKQGLWYNDTWPSSGFTNTWVAVAARHAGNPLVAYDLKNEWRPAVIGGATVTPTWGTGDPATDVARLMRNTIDRIRAVDPGCLCACEGLSYASDLSAWGAHRIGRPNVVASAHDYPWYHRHADKTPQTWDEYKAQNDARWGYLAQQDIAPVWLGECGRNTDEAGAAVPALDAGWFPNFLRYMGENPQVSWCWWELSATAVLGTMPATNVVKVQQGQREGFGLMSGQDWLGSQAATLARLAPVM